MAILWAHFTTYKKLTKHTLFQLVYGKEVLMSMEFLVPSPHVALMTRMAEDGGL